MHRVAVSAPMLRAALLVALLVLLPVVAASHVASAPYTLANGQFAGRVFGANVGGAWFAPNGHVPAHVAVADASGTRAPFLACQDVGGAGCGFSAADPYVTGCGSADLAGASPAFRADLALEVYVAAATLGCPGGVGTRGTITVAYG